MGTYKFIYESNEPGFVDVAVRYDETDYTHITDVLNAFVMFLKGVTFADETISKYIDTAKIEGAMVRRV